MEKQLVIGVDFGSDSARAIVMDAQDGKKLGGRIALIRAGCAARTAILRARSSASTRWTIWRPFERCVRGALESAGADAAAHVKGIAVDTTGSNAPRRWTRTGLPLAMREEFRDNPNAMFYMWKDHSANEEAALVNEVLSNFENEDYTRFQGRYSSEWWWAKILHARRVAPDVCAQAVTWVRAQRLDPLAADRAHISRAPVPQRLRRGPQSAVAQRFRASRCPPRGRWKRFDPLPGPDRQYLCRAADRRQRGGHADAGVGAAAGPARKRRGGRRLVRRARGRGRRGRKAQDAGKSCGHFHGGSSGRGAGRAARQGRAGRMRPGGKLHHSRLYRHRIGPGGFRRTSSPGSAR